MEIGEVNLSFSDRLLAEAAVERAQNDGDPNNTATLVNPFTIHSNLETEFEKRSQILSNNKENFLELKKMVGEGKANCSLRCFSRASLITLAWGNLAYGFTCDGQEGGKDLSRVFTPEELCEPKQGEELSKTLVGLMMDHARKGYTKFYQGCGALPINSCQKMGLVKQSSKILDELNKTCSDLRMLSVQLHEDQLPHLKRSKINRVMQIAEKITKECNSLALGLSTQGLYIEVWPVFQGHFHHLDQSDFTSQYETTSIHKLLQADLGLSWTKLAQEFGLINLVSLYKQRDLMELRRNPNIDLRQTLSGGPLTDGTYAPSAGSERVSPRVRESANQGEEVLECKKEADESEINIVKVVYGNCMDTGEAPREIEGAEDVSPDEFSPPIEHRSRAVGKSNSNHSRNLADIPSPPFEPLENTSPRPIHECSLEPSKPNNEPSDLEPQAGNSNFEGPAGNSNEESCSKAAEKAVPPVRVRLTRQVAAGDQPGVTYIVSELIKPAARVKHDTPGAPPYHGGVTFEEAKRTLNLGNIEDFFEFKKRTEHTYGNWSIDGILEFQTQDDWGEWCFEWRNSPENSLWAIWHEQGVNRLRVPQAITGPIYHLLHSPLVEHPARRNDFKRLIGDWVEFMRCCTRIRQQPLGCLMCQNQGFTYIYYGMEKLRRHLFEFHRMKLKECFDLHKKELSENPTHQARFKKWSKLASEINERLEKRLENMPGSTSRDPNHLVQKSQGPDPQETSCEGQVDDDDSSENRSLGVYRRERSKGSKHKGKTPKDTPSKHKNSGRDGNTQKETKKTLLRGCITQAVEEQNRLERESQIKTQFKKVRVPEGQTSDAEDPSILQIYTDGERLTPYD